MGKLKLTGERGEDTDLQSAGKRVRLSGLHVRADVFREDRPGPYRLPAIKEEHSARGREFYALTERSCTWQETTTLVGKVNRMLRGWATYFSVGAFSKAYRALDAYAAARVRRWLRFKHNVRRRRGGSYPLSHLYGHFGLVRLSWLWHHVPWTKVLGLSESRMQETCLSGSMRGGVETEPRLSH